LEPNSLKRDEREEVSRAPPSVWASVGAAAATTGVGTGAGSFLEVLGAFAVLVVAVSLEGVATGTAAVGAGVEEEVFFAILCWYTLLCEVFLSIFRRYILY
jgi:hypothetical protein